jgi:hypothetical protein
MVCRLMSTRGELNKASLPLQLASHGKPEAIGVGRASLMQC